MAKKLVLPMAWTPPPVTEEEALTPDYSNKDDGYIALDRLVRERPPTKLTEWEQYEADREAQKQAIIDADFQKSRGFQIDEKYFTGKPRE